MKHNHDIAVEEVITPPPRQRFPIASIALFALAGVSVLIYLAGVIWQPFADFFSRYPGAVVRGFMAYLTSWIPFSFAEAFLLFMPVTLFFIIRIVVKKYSDSWHNTFVYIGILISIASLLLTLWCCGFGIAYKGSSLNQKLQLERKDVSAEELKYTASVLVEKIKEEAQNVTFRDQNFSVMPYSLNEMNDKLLDAYDKISDEHKFIPRLYSRVKPVVLSEPWSYTHITGVYTYFTGEANLNVNFPDYTLPFTAAHELAHQRGVAREDEANFMAFLVCITSDDPYIRYSGYLNMYEYVASSLYSANADMYFEVLNNLPDTVRYEMRAYSAFFDKYRENVVADVSEVVNDTYLKVQGTEGTRSYGMVTDLAVAYYKKVK